MLASESQPLKLMGAPTPMGADTKFGTEDAAPQFTSIDMGELPEMVLDEDISGEIDTAENNALMGDSPPANSSAQQGSSNSESSGGILGSCTPSCCKLEFYQTFFDVSTEQVVDRIHRSLAPNKITSPFFLPAPLESPDLYGPFWVCTTLIFVTTVMANTATWLGTYLQDPDDAEAAVQWSADFEHLTYSATLYYGVISFLPFAVYLALKYFAGAPKTLVELVSLYGYSLVVYIPAAILCVIPISGVAWFAAIYAFCSSTAFLLTNMAIGTIRPQPGATLNVSATTKASVTSVFFAVIAGQAGVALMSKLFFFGAY